MPKNEEGQSRAERELAALNHLAINTRTYPSSYPWRLLRLPRSYLSDIERAKPLTDISVGFDATVTTVAHDNDCIMRRMGLDGAGAGRDAATDPEPGRRGARGAAQPGAAPASR
ncbi:unnamed protein product [Nezara viridula]|uniref:Uncharacterized protein n=1 Tax=Nezara viridula TaxID=85310 RepID=A0A9P0HH15_NEZVI|nr:unnamed protein product [Nezara viridula]